MEGDAVQVGSLERLPEAAHELGAVERSAGLGVAEHEVTVARVERALVQLGQCDRDALCHRDRSARADGLRIAEFTADVRRHHANLVRLEVDVAPAQAEQLALAQAGHGRRQIQHRLDTAEGITRKLRGQESLER